MSSWIYLKDGRRAGPFSPSRIAKAVLNGKLETDESILCIETQMWHKIKDVPQIMEIIHKPLPGGYFTDIDSDTFASFVDGKSPENREPIFFNFPWRWLLFLQIISLGTFQLYWLIRQYGYLRTPKPSFRFMFLRWPYEIFSAIERDKTLGRISRPGWSVMMLSLIWYSSLPLLLVGLFTINPILSVILSYPVVIFGTSLVIIPIQKYINECNAKLGKKMSKIGLGFYLDLLLCLVWVFFVIRGGKL